MVWLSCPRSFLLKNSSTVFFDVVNWTIEPFGLCLFNATVSYLASFPPLFISIVAIFVTSLYLDNEFVVMCYAYLTNKSIGKTCSMLAVNIVKLSLLFLQYPQKLKLRGSISLWDKCLTWRIILCMISCVHIWTHFLFSKEQIYIVVLIYW